MERYIGTCLISKAEVSTPASYRDGYRDGYRYPHGAHAGGPHGAWAGLPLISMVQPRRNNKSPQQQPPPAPQQPQPQPAAPPRSPLSRLAIHTQGAPLILAGRYNGGRKHGQNGQPSGQAKGGSRGHRPGPGPMCGPCGSIALGPHLPASNKQPATASSDSLSVASDESSGHSENSLPRIIKPRKRRKKDRKPPQLAADSTPTTPAQQQAPAAPASVPTVSLKSLGDAEHAVEHSDEPKLHHDFDEVKEHDAADESVLLCQCRYCDPAGLIWDVDQNCYSPFLTPQPQPQHLSSFPLFISDSPRASPRLFLDSAPARATCGPVGTPVGSRTDLLLRRSWSEPSPSRKHSESSDSQESDRRSPPTHQALEVSSEIVTSHYGHRDIEIKFFSLPAAELDKQ